MNTNTFKIVEWAATTTNKMADISVCKYLDTDTFSIASVLASTICAHFQL